MTPSATATSRRATVVVATSRAAQRPVRPSEAPAYRPPLRVVEHQPRRRQVRRRRVVPILSLALVVGSLLLVVVGHAMLAEGQVRLSAAQSALSAEQATNRQETLSVAQLENPSRIVRKAQQQLHMVPRSQVDQLPYVALDTPLPTPAVGPAPTTTSAPPPTSTTASSTPATAPGQ